MSEERKRCPKCGSPYLIRVPWVPPWLETRWRLVCEDCGHRGPEGASIGEAIRLWNEQEGGHPMRIFKSKPYRHAERALRAAQTQEQVDIVRANAHVSLTAKEFGHFVKKVAARRQQLADQWGREAAT